MLLGKNFLYKQAGLFSLQKTFQKGCFVSFEWYKALSANPGTLQKNFDSKGYRELLEKEMSEIVYSKIRHSPLNSECSG